MAPSTSQRSESRAEQLLTDLLSTQGWDTQPPPKGSMYIKGEYMSDQGLKEALSSASKSGAGAGIPEAILMESGRALLVVEAKAMASEIARAVKEATAYGDALLEHDHHPLAVALAGTEIDDCRIEVLKHDGTRWQNVTYDGTPISWMPSKADLVRLAVADSNLEMRPSPPPDDVLAERADEINRLLREADIKDEYRPTHVAAIMLALWQTKGRIRRDPEYILVDVNAACKRTFEEAGKINLASSIRVDEANEKLRLKSIIICKILELLNVTRLTAEHDYLGQLYETFFRYAGGNTIGQYFTPRHIARMMVDACEASSSDRVLDIACGTGGFFVAFMDRLVEEEGLSRSAMVDIIQNQIVGFESEPNTAALCAANMLLRGDGSTQIRQADSLTIADFPAGEASIAVMNPPFPHKKTDTPVQDFVDRSLEGLRHGGKLAAIVPSSLLVKTGLRAWRTNVLLSNSLTAVCQLPDDLFQPFAKVTTSILFLTKGRPQSPHRRTIFVRLSRDGMALRKNARIPNPLEPNEVPRAVDAIINGDECPGFSTSAQISGGDEWSPGAYIQSQAESPVEQINAVDILMRRLASFYTRYGPEILNQRRAVSDGDIEVVSYLDHVSDKKRTNAKNRSGASHEIGGLFDILYGLSEIESRTDIPAGPTLVVSPTEQYNGCNGWYEFPLVLAPPFITVARTGSIGEAFVHIEHVAPNSDCLVLLPRTKKWTAVPMLILAAAAIRQDRWRYNYGRKITPERIAKTKLSYSDEVIDHARQLWREFESVIEASLAPYSGPHLLRGTHG